MDFVVICILLSLTYRDRDCLNDEITPIRDCYRFAYFHDMTVESLLYQAVDRVDHNLMQAITKYN